jgi:hypothetical protein
LKLTRSGEKPYVEQDFKDLLKAFSDEKVETIPSQEGLQ